MECRRIKLAGEEKKKSGHIMSPCPSSLGPYANYHIQTVPSHLGRRDGSGTNPSQGRKGRSRRQSTRRCHADNGSASLLASMQRCIRW
ncbi:hypothetical protein CORC01_03580 [Colletotrichum orchidophilum]|uniref:Uncharacterized protein n=1 Tax=Colletotrichum orchidophilum TaxID=1209926 RepID=A0A1G4BI47_9PEZI|nr:uncharacterized protein CORC01_03580 [Colletotrichum orchidophilum]OHF01013.1 hypothetical protein CORC01_03580 [Colletotrichum orchidophilum]